MITRDVGRIFFGRDMQCAQCHDHPLVGDYHQADDHGLYAFVSGGFAFTAPDPDKKTYYAERAGVDDQFESVFVKGTKHVTGPRLPGGVQPVWPSLLPGQVAAVQAGITPWSRRLATVLSQEPLGGRERGLV